MKVNVTRQKSRNEQVNKVVRIAIAKEDSIGPEIMKATLSILKAARANIKAEYIEVGKQFIYQVIRLE